MPLSRRSFLKAAGAAAVSVPMLRSFQAFGGEFPKRLVIFFQPHGTVRDMWLPTGNAAAWHLSPILESLAPFQSKITVIDGVNLKSADADYQGDQHATGMCHALTGTRMAYGAGGITGGGISVDQHIADAIGRANRFKSLELGVQTAQNAYYASYWTRCCFRGAGEPVPPEDDPWAVFERVFSDMTRDPLELETMRAERRSVMDVVHQDLDRLQARMPAEDRPLLEAHLTSIREIEVRLQDPANGLGKYCATPTLGSRIDDVQLAASFPDVGRLQMDLLAMSLACDLTRVATLQWSSAVSPMVYSWLDVGLQDAHSLSHYYAGDATFGEDGAFTRIQKWYGEQFAYLLGKLDSIPEGTGTLLDNTLVVWANELGKGNLHMHDVPWVLAGGAGGAIPMGRFLEYDDESHNDLLVSICNAMDVPTSTYGDEDFCTGALDGLA